MWLMSESVKRESVRVWWWWGGGTDRDTETERPRHIRERDKGKREMDSDILGLDVRRVSMRGSRGRSEMSWPISNEGPSGNYS